ncbi:hypothetical protein E2542_SST29360 [Spatholobus suberectus]|nr:hypothetical protein E2542_SST29360 [Spatholobus suberectus]
MCGREVVMSREDNNNITSSMSMFFYDQIPGTYTSFNNGSNGNQNYSATINTGFNPNQNFAGAMAHSVAYAGNSNRIPYASVSSIYSGNRNQNFSSAMSISSTYSGNYGNFGAFHTQNNYR